MPRVSGFKFVLSFMVFVLHHGVSGRLCSVIVALSGLLYQFLIFFITKTYLYHFDSLKPHIFIVKLGFIGVYIIFLISAQKHRL